MESFVCIGNRYINIFTKTILYGFSSDIYYRDRNWFLHVGSHQQRSHKKQAHFPCFRNIVLHLSLPFPNHSLGSFSRFSFRFPARRSCFGVDYHCNFRTLVIFSLKNPECVSADCSLNETNCSPSGIDSITTHQKHELQSRDASLFPMITLKNVTLRRSAKVLSTASTPPSTPENMSGWWGAMARANRAFSHCSTAPCTKTGATSSFRRSGACRRWPRPLPRTDEPATDFVVAGDTRLMEVQARLAQAEADDDGMALAHAYTDLHDAGSHDAVPRAQALILGLGFKVSLNWTNPSTALPAAGACACSSPAR